MTSLEKCDAFFLVQKQAASASKIGWPLLKQITGSRTVAAATLLIAIYTQCISDHSLLFRQVAISLEPTFNFTALNP